MKKALLISIIAIIMISCLQGYNIYLQHHNYIQTKLAEINPIIYQSIDEELNIRQRKKFKPDTIIGTQHSFLKIYKPGEKAPQPKKGESVIRMDSFDVKKLKAEGIVKAQADILLLLNQDIQEAKGNGLNLAVLDTIFYNNLQEDYKYSILLLNKEKKLLRLMAEKIFLSLGFIPKIMP